MCLMHHATTLGSTGILMSIVIDIFVFSDTSVHFTFLIFPPVELFVYDCGVMLFVVNH